MSSHIKDQQQQQKTENKREFDADHLFNQHLMKTLAYTGIGFGFGMLSSLFFKHRAGMTMFFAGTGAAYGAKDLMSDLDHYRKFQSYNNQQQQQTQTFQRQGQLESQDWQKYMPREQSHFQQKNYQRGGSDDDDNKNQNKSTEDERDLTYSQKLAEAGAKKDEAKGVKPSGKIDGGDEKSSGKDEKTQKFAENKKHDIKKQQDQAKPQQQQDSKKEQSKDQGSQQKQELKKDSSKSDNKQQQKQQSQDKHSSSRGGEQSKPQSYSSNYVDGNTQLKVEGQQFMDFKSNPYDAGKPAPGENSVYRGSFRSTKGSNQDLAKGPDSHRAEQDRWGKSTGTGLKNNTKFSEESKAGSQFNGDNLTARSQVNAVIE